MDYETTGLDVVNDHVVEVGVVTESGACLAQWLALPFLRKDQQCMVSQTLS